LDTGGGFKRNREAIILVFCENVTSVFRDSYINEWRTETVIVSCVILRGETIPISFYDFAGLIIIFLFIFFIIYAIIYAKYGER